jgi:hypothetical protein
MAKATLFVVPLRRGGGTRFKRVNAISMGKVAISIAIRAKGLWVIDVENVVVANEVNDFALAVDTYFQDADTW